MSSQTQGEKEQATVQEVETEETESQEKEEKAQQVSRDKPEKPHPKRQFWGYCNDEWGNSFNI